MKGKRRYIVALDQGTTSSRCVIFDNECNIVDVVSKEFKQIYPCPGWVEHDPMEIYASQYAVMSEAVARCGIKPYHIQAIGITNQRETTIVWDKNTGKPIYNAIVWQCRRTANIVEQVKKDGLEEYIKENTGLVLDAYFSATKIKWILDNVKGAKEKAKNGELLFGTVDTWLLYKLTGGKVFATDYTNASRTMLFNIKELKWDKKLCDYFDIPMSMLPEVKNSSADFGEVSLFGYNIPITGVAGDQQASLFGQACFEKGDIKNTYGTGCFLLMNIGNEFINSKHGLITTIAATHDEKVQYALEGSVFVGGALIQWLRDEMRLIVDAADSEYFALKAKNNGGVYIVPAFTGLGAPYWDMYARGTIFGLTRGANRNHIIRASLEAIAYQTMDVINSMAQDTNIKIKHLKVDGGASMNNFLMQFQADIIDASVSRSKIMETTALGAALLAGLKVKVFDSLEEIKQKWRCDQKYYPQISKDIKDEYIKKWHKAVRMCKGWEDENK
ncbi:MAG: glycerol kinase GlpK [Erysipelotrichaceae bacterium]|nr:glycerol kinase GlpK [Erysipelotrichaceae bacterium]